MLFITFNFFFSSLRCNFVFQLSDSNVNEDCAELTQDYIFNDVEDFEPSEKYNTVITEERREQFRQIKFGLVKERPFDERLKKVYVKKSFEYFCPRLVCLISRCSIKTTTFSLLHMVDITWNLF